MSPTADPPGGALPLLAFGQFTPEYLRKVEGGKAVGLHLSQKHACQGLGPRGRAGAA